MIKHERTADVDLRLRRVSGAARCIAAIAVPITSIAVLAATVCMAPRIALAQITLSGSNGYTLSWNGNQFWSGTVPTNLASASGTANAFGSGQLTPTGHAIVNINDGLYGNGESWINGAEAAPYYIGIRFPQAADLSSIAWSRANTSPVTNSDRSVGSYTIQFTTVASPGTSTASGDWTTIGTVTLGAATGDYAPYQRHEYTLADSSGGPITGVTGIRILTFSGACIDEISTFRQVYRTTGSGDLYAANSFSTAVTGGTTTTPYVGDILAFSATTSATQAITLGGTSQNARAMRFSTSDAVTFTAGGTNGTLSLGYLADIATGVTNLGVGNRTTSGGTTLTLDAGAGAVTIGSATAGQQVAIALNASNTWVNNSANTLTVNNGVSRFSTDGTSRMLTVSGSGATAIAGVIANGGTDGTLALTKSGAGTLTLSASNSYTGLTTVTAGTLALGDAGSLLATGSVALAGSGATFDLSAASGDRTIGMLTGTAGSVVALGARTLTVGDATSGTFAGGIGGTGGLTKVGGGLLALTGSSSYSGTTSITAGTLQIGHANAFGTGTISFGGGTLRYGSGITTDVSGRVSTAAGQAYNVDTNGNTVTWATALASSGGTLTKSGAGTLVLSASNSYTGPTVASAGVLQFATKAALYGGETASWVPDTINVKSGATLALDVGGTGEFDSTDVATLLVNLASSTSASSGLNAGAALGFDTANAAGGVFTLSTAVADTTGAAGGAIGLVKLGSGAITLSVANSYSGGTTLSAGQLNIDNASALGTGTFTIAGSGTIDNTSGGAITLSTNNPQAWNTDVTFVGSNPLDVGTGTVTLSANRLVTVTSSTLTVGGGIRGAFSLTKAGAGALVLSGSNARSGGTTLNAGRLSIDNAAALGTGTFTIAGSGTIDNTSGAAVTLSTNNPQAWNADFTFAGTNPLNLGTGAVSFSATRSVTVTSSTLTAGGSFGGSAALTKAGAGTLALTGISTHSGTINLNAGTLQLGNIGTAGRSNVVVAAGAALELTGSAASIGTLSGTTAASIALGNATLTINQATDQYYYGTISGSGGLTLSGTQPLRLMTPNTYAGPTAANGSNSLFSVLVLQGTANLLPSTTVVTLSNVAQVDLYGFTQTWAGLAGTAGNIYSFGETGAPLVLGVASDMTYAYAGRLGTATGGAYGMGFSVVKNGAGTQVFTGSNSYTRGTTINEGTLGFANNSLGTTGTVTLNGGVLRWQTGNVQDLSGRLRLVSGSTATLDTNGNNVTFGTSFGGTTSADLVKQGAGTLTLSASTSYTGSTRIGGGTLSLASVNALAGSTLDLNAADSGTVTFGVSGTNTYNLGGLTGSRNLATSGSVVLAVGGNGTSGTYSGVISGGGALTKVGSGVLTLSGSNSYSGGTTLNAGILSFGTSALGTSGTVTLNGGTLQWATGNTEDISSRLVLVSGSTASLDTNGNDVTLATGFGGSTSAALVKLGAGTLALTGSNSYSGGTTLSAGTLGFANGSLGSSGTITLNGGVLRWEAGNTQDISARLALVSGSTATLDTQANSVTLATGFGGSTSAALVKLGSGTLALSGSNSYSGGTTLNAGVLAFGSNALGPSGAVTLNGGTLRWATGNTSDISGRLALVSGSTATLDTNGNNVTLATGLGGSTSAAVVKAGAGTLTLTGSNSYTGGTTISGGTLQVGAGSTAGSITGDVTNNAALAFNRSDDVTYANVISGTGLLVKSGAGRLNLTGANPLSGATTVSAGTLAVNGSLADGAITVSGGALGGSGTVGVVTIASGGTIAPGNSPGTLTTGAMTWAGGGAYDWQLYDAAGSAGTGWDFIRGTGPLTINATGGNKFTINLLTLSGTNPDVAGNALNFNSATSGTWALGSFTSIAGFDPSAFSINTTGFTNSRTGGFAVTTSGGTLNLVYDIFTSYEYTGGTGNWSTAGNWLGGSTPNGTAAITFSGTGGGTATNDISAATLPVVYGLTFSSTAGAYTVAGPITLGVGGVVNNSAVVQTLSGSVSLGSSSVVNAATGGITLTGTLATNGNPLAVAGTGTVSIGAGGTSGALVGDVVNNGRLAFNRSDAVTYAGAISGAGSVTKLSTGTLTLSGSNSHSGGTTLSAGRLNIANASALGTGTFTIAGSGTLDNTSGGAITLTTNNPQAWNANFAFAGTNPLNLGTGTVSFSTTRSVTVTSSTLTAGGAYGGSATLTKAGAGTLALTGSSSHTGQITVSAGRLQLGNTGTAARSNLSVAAGATLELTGTAASIGNVVSNSGNIALGNATLTINQVTDHTLSGVISGSGGIVQSGSSNLRLTGSSTYTGPTVVNAGILVLQGAANRLSPSTVVYLNGGQIDINDSVQTWAGLSGSAGANIYSFQTTTGSLVLNVASGTSYTYAGTLGTVHSGYSVVKNGGGTQVFTGANVYTRGTTLNSGTLGFANNSLGTSGTVTLNGGVLRWETGNTQDLSARLRLVSGSTATLDTNGNNVTFATSFGGTTSAALVKQGAGTLTLSASNSYTGGTTISAGTLAIGHGSSVGGGPLTFTGDATFRATTSGLSVANAVDVNPGVTATIQTSTNVNLTLSGNLSGSGTLQTVPNATATLFGLLLAGTNSDFTGTISVRNFGTVRLNSTSAAPANGTVNIEAGGALTPNVTDGGTFSIGALTGSGTVFVQPITTNTSTLSIGGLGQSTAFSGVFGNGSGRIAVTKIGSGTMTLNRTGGNGQAIQNVEVSGGRLVLSGTGITFNTGYFTGTTPLTARSGGTLELAANWITSSTNVITADGGTVLLSNGSVVDASTYINNLTLKDGGVLSGNAPRMGYFGDATITATGSIASTSSAGLRLLQNTGRSDTLFLSVADVTSSAAADLTISGAIVDDGSFPNLPVVKTGAGTLMLSGTNTFGGTLAVREGTLSIATINNASTSGVLGNSAIAVTLGGTAGTLGTLAYTGATASSTKPFTLATGGTGGFSVAAGANLTLSGSITGGGGLLKTGAGTLTFTAAQTYTGTTIISGGTLALSSLASLDSAFIKAGAAELDGGTLDVTGLTAGGLAVKNGQTLGGHGTVIGDVVIAGGATLAPGGSIGSLDQAGTLEWGGGGTFIFQVTNANGSTPGTSWDLMTADALDITASLGSEFVIQLQSLTNGSDQTPGALAPGNWNGEQSYSWKFFVADTSITSFDPMKFILDTSSFQSLNSAPGMFSLAQGGVGAGRVGGSSTDSELYIIYAAVPEPRTLALAGIGVATVAWALRRRRGCRVGATP